MNSMNFLLFLIFISVEIFSKGTTDKQSDSVNKIQNLNKLLIELFLSSVGFDLFPLFSGRYHQNR